MSSQPVDLLHRSAPPGPSGRRWAALGGEVLAGVVVAVVVSLALQWLIGRVHLPYPSNEPAALLTLASAIILAIGLLLASRRRWPRWATPLTWAGLTAMTTVPIALLLNGTRYYLGGVEIDQSFRTEYLTRLTSSAALADMNYQNVPPFYPAGWFWFGGRFANLLGLPGWAAFKPWAMVTTAISAVVCFALWSVLVRRQIALLLAVVTALLGLHIDGAAEPYSWLLVGLIPPLAGIAWRMVREAGQPDRGPATGPVVVLGLALGLFGAVYTLLFGFLGLTLVLIAAVNLVVAWRSRETKIGPLIRRTLGRAVSIGLIALVPVLLVWTPYLLRVLSAGSKGNAAARYLPAASASLPTPMLDFTVGGALCLIGLGWIVFTATRNPIAAALGIVVGTCYLWYLLSTVALFANTTLLAFRVYPILMAALMCAGVLGAIEATKWMLGRFGQFRIRALATIGAFAVLLTMVQDAPTVYKDAVTAAFKDPYPTGGNASGAVDPNDDNAWAAQLNDTIARLSGKRPEDLVLLANGSVLLGGEPYWTYLSATKHYGNPLVDYDGRRAAVAQWATARTPDQLIADLDRSPGPTPTVFVLTRDEGKSTAHIDLNYDIFPADPNVRVYPVTFSLATFDGPQFARADVGPFTVLVRR